MQWDTSWEGCGGFARRVVYAGGLEVRLDFGRTRFFLLSLDRIELAHERHAGLS